MSCGDNATFTKAARPVRRCVEEGREELSAGPSVGAKTQHEASSNDNTTSHSNVSSSIQTKRQRSAGKGHGVRGVGQEPRADNQGTWEAGSNNQPSVHKIDNMASGNPSALGRLFNAFTVDSGCDVNFVSDDEETVKKQKRLTNEDRATIVGCLEMAIKKHGKVPQSEKFHLAERCKVTERSVSAVWKRHRETGCHRTRRHNCGRKPKWNSSHLDKMLEIPLEFKETLRSLAEALQIPLSSLHVPLRKSATEGIVRRTSGYLKPMLDDCHKLRRIQFIKEHIKADGTFDDMMDKVHIDEKWFYIDKKKRTS